MKKKIHMFWFRWFFLFGIFVAGGNACEGTHKSIEISEIIKASPSVIYDYITVPEKLCQWWTKDAQVSLSDKTYHYTWEIEGLTYTRDGNFLNVSPSSSIAFTWNPVSKRNIDLIGTQNPEDFNKTIVTFQLEEAAELTGQTFLKLIHSGWENSAIWETLYTQHFTAWKMLLEQLRITIETAGFK
jgi:uncharacterized protein YndB with AHSA1/START domain